MNNKPYCWIVIDRLEYYVIKEIERAIYNNEDEKSFSSLYQRVLECINARKELNYDPLYMDVEELLEDYGYDSEYIRKFVTLSQLDAKERELIDRIDGIIEKQEDIEIHQLLKDMQSYVLLRNKIDCGHPINNIEALLNKYGYDKRIIKSLKEKHQKSK